MSEVALGSNAKRLLEEQEKAAKNEQRRKNLRTVGLAALLYAVTAVLFGIFLHPKQEWFFELNKPSFLLPLSVFIIAWTTVYAILTFLLAKYAILQGSKFVVMEFAFNAFLTVLWSLFFFSVKSPFAGLIAIIFLLIYAWFLFSHTKPVLKNWSFLLLIYIAWLCYAALLNYCILIMN